MSNENTPFGQQPSNENPYATQGQPAPGYNNAAPQGGYQQSPQGGYGQAPQSTGTDGLSIAAIICAVVVAPVGLILGIVAFLKRKKLGLSRGVALAAIVVGAILTVGGGIAVGVGVTAVATATQQIQEQCSEDGTTHAVIEGTEVACPKVSSTN